MQPWKVVFDEDAFHFFLSRRGFERQRLLSAFEQLRNDPYQKSSYAAKDLIERDTSMFGRRNRF